MDTYGEDGFQIIELLMENNSGSTPSTSDLQSWANTYGFTSVANLADDANVWTMFEMDYGIPSIAWIGPDMTILGVETGNTNPESYL